MTNHTSRAWIPKRNATPTRSAGADDRSGAPSAGRGKQCPPRGWLLADRPEHGDLRWPWASLEATETSADSALGAALRCVD
jgi:hypothetical protein